MKKPRKSYGRRFIFPSFFFIISLCILASFNEFRYDNFLQSGLCAFTLQKAPNMSVLENLLSTNSPPNYDIKILVGILTLPDQYQKRHFLRLIYGTQSPSGAKVDVKFVFCNRTKEDQRTLTYTYFSSLPELFNSSSNHQPYDYVMKADDDIYIRLDNLVESLRPLPKEDLYYGFVIPCNSMDPFVHYMSGMAYLVSWDIVEWIRRSDIPRNHRQGPEDKVMGEWLLPEVEAAIGIMLNGLCTIIRILIQDVHMIFGRTLLRFICLKIKKSGLKRWVTSMLLKISNHRKCIIYHRLCYAISFYIFIE
ncbi:hypothetical protein Leryth_018612 [Lithospermum erythrorhizon]|nr:hypothetical protein Leryth_018612 [Lithospermum erythrorhizon]